MTFQQSYSLSGLNTLRLKSSAKYFISLIRVEQLDEITDFIQQRQLSFFVLGGGSNLILPEFYPGLVIYNQLFGIEKLDESDMHIRVKVMAGMVWDDFVAYTLKRGWFGLENLSLIPGTIGAAPIQNIGAYGVEAKDFIETVEVYDMQHKIFITLTNQDCQFSYRHSIFKTKPQYIVIAVVFRLLKVAQLNFNYADIKLQLAAIKNPTAQQLRKCVIKTRQNKLPDPLEIGNVGSFFHNPVLAKVKVQELLAKYPNLPIYPINNEVSKVSAGWLIDNLGLKGYIQGKVGVYFKQALVLVNHGAATQNEILGLARFIQAKVLDNYAITLNIEPIIIYGLG